MKSCAFALLLVFVNGSIFAQNSATFPKNKYADIFNSIFLQNKNLYGIFDSTDSWFLVHQDTVFQSQFDSLCLRCTGKTWHKAEIDFCSSYFTILQLENESIKWKNDTMPLSQEDSLLKKTIVQRSANGDELWKCEGEYFVNEDVKDPYSGRFVGTFHIYFFYNRKMNTISQANHFTLPDDAPSALFNGFWRSFRNKKQGGISYFWSTNSPLKKQNNTYILPDYRFQADGSFSYTNTATFDIATVFPTENWYK